MKLGLTSGRLVMKWGSNFASTRNAVSFSLKEFLRSKPYRMPEVHCLRYFFASFLARTLKTRATGCRY